MESHPTPAGPEEKEAARGKNPGFGAQPHASAEKRETLSARTSSEGMDFEVYDCASPAPKPKLELVLDLEIVDSGNVGHDVKRPANTLEKL